MVPVFSLTACATGGLVRAMRTLSMVMVVVVMGCDAEQTLMQPIDAGSMTQPSQPASGSVVPAFDSFTAWALNGTGSGAPAVVELAGRPSLPAGARQVQLLVEVCYGGSGITQTLYPVTVALGGPVEFLDDTSRRIQTSVECQLDGQGASTRYTSQELWVELTSQQQLAVWGVPPPNASRSYPFLYRLKLLAWRAP